jgi:hypothetical protein
MNILEMAQEAIQLIQQGRSALQDITQAVNDGRAAVDAHTKAELDAMLEREEGETRDAYAALNDAIEQAQS